MKRNIKGFTLIELLAVIIILGVLMLIAIPSVTEYISSSRKSAFVDTASSYVSTVRNKVNQGEALKFYDTSTFYLVQVGHDKTTSCVSLEKGGASPFNDTWKYNYVGVTYDGNGYTYYYMGRDGSGQGVKLVAENTMAKQGKDLVLTVSATTGMTTAIDDALGTLINTTYVTGTAGAGETSMNTNLKTVVDSATGGNYSRIVVVKKASASTECTY